MNKYTYTKTEALSLTGWQRRDRSSWSCWFRWSTCKYSYIILIAAVFYLFLIHYHQTTGIAVSQCINKHFFDLEVTQLKVKLIFSFLQKIKWSWKVNAYNCLIVYLFNKEHTEMTVFRIREDRRVSCQIRNDVITSAHYPEHSLNELYLLLLSVCLLSLHPYLYVVWSMSY